MKYEQTYKGKKVFLTGHTGFKGAWMLYWLYHMGAHVKGYALAPETPDDLYNVIKGDTLCESVIAEIRDRERVKKEILAFEPDFVFHLAAQPLVRLSYEIPIDTFEINAIGTANVLDALRFLEKPCIAVMITTDKVYENKEWVYPYRENDRLGGYDPYSASKACAEIVIDSYCKSFFNLKEFDKHQKAIAITRAGNVIGGGDWSKDRIIPDIARALQKKEDVIIRNPNAVRPWQHVLEPIDGYLYLGKKLVENPFQYAGAYNFGPLLEDTITVKELAQIAIQHWGEGRIQTPQLSGQPHEAGLLKLDISKAMTLLGWKPKLNSAQAIAMAIDWYKFYSEKPTEIAHFTKNQIEIFVS
ncbi:MAG: CDP-glucose 4,6-dehydratase [Cytophagales bacterium]|nr:CDP-glucose 4,6-dehydratase [Cytophagales bacterium]MDW8384876.1 CDP-glucose 4,6-dehydratase [Flammeovirgaceae bacterium]